MQKLKNALRNAVYQLTGLTFYKKLPFGIDPFEDIRFNFNNYPFETFFDVGANIGQSVNHIRRIFPKAAIYCFEPISSTFEILKQNTAQKNVRCFQMGLGSNETELEILLDKSGIHSDRNSLKSPQNVDSSEMVKEIIRIDTLDNFCSSNSIGKIDYLKVDTEGYDLDVLKGSINFINDQKISFIEVEVGMNPENDLHVSLEEIKMFLEKHQYRVYGIYEQMYEWPTNTPILRRVNAVFISPAIYKK